MPELTTSRSISSTASRARAPPTSHASLERTQPIRIEGPVGAPYEDFDALRAVVSGYQSLRRLSREERASLPPVMRYAAARADARALIAGNHAGAVALSSLQAISDRELSALAG